MSYANAIDQVRQRIRDQLSYAAENGGETNQDLLKELADYDKLISLSYRNAETEAEEGADTAYNQANNEDM